MWKYVFIALLLAMGGYATFMTKDPYNTQLPYQFSDMHTVQEQLLKLDPADQALVTDYMRRSNGDRLPASIGDPDSPFTANTFKEAIRLEKEFKARYPVGT